MATQNKAFKKAFLAAVLLGSAGALVYACGGDDSTPGPVIPMPDGGAGSTAAGAGGSAGAGGAGGSDAAGAAGDAAGSTGEDSGIVDTDGAGGSAGSVSNDGAAGASGGASTCQPSGSFDNAGRLKDLLLPDGGLKPL
jgi:hypothetical protein